MRNFLGKNRRLNDKNVLQCLLILPYGGLEKKMMVRLVFGLGGSPLTEGFLQAADSGSGSAAL